MKFPDRCPECKAIFGDPPNYACLLVRSELDFDSDDDTRIEDQIYECSACHTLFRVRFELVSFVQLKEKELDA